MTNHQDMTRKRRFLPGLIIGLITISIVSFLPSWLESGTNSSDIEAVSANEPRLNILFLSVHDNPQVEKALRLDESFNIIKNAAFDFAWLTSNDIKTVVIADYSLSSAQISDLKAFFNAGGNIFLVFGPRSPQASSLLSALGLENTLTNRTLQNKDSKGVNAAPGMEGNVIAMNVQWSSCPSVRAYTDAGFTNATVDVIIEFKENEISHAAIASFSKVGSGQLMMLMPWTVPGGDNVQIEVWPYFNYAIYLITAFLNTDDPSKLPTFAQWSHSPVPHAQDTLIIAIIVSVLGIVAFSLFFYQRRRSRQSQIVLSEKAMAEIVKDRIQKKLEKEDITKSWEQIGTHKQIAGFLFGLFAGIILGIPQIVLTGIVFPRWIMPYPQVAGWFDWVKQFFQAIWMIFDVGTSIALAKYFAQYRIKQPHKAIHYVQIFVWWQMLSGVVQIVIISLIGSVTPAEESVLDGTVIYRDIGTPSPDGPITTVSDISTSGLTLISDNETKVLSLDKATVTYGLPAAWDPGVPTESNPDKLYISKATVVFQAQAKTYTLSGVNATMYEEADEDTVFNITSGVYTTNSRGSVNVATGQPIVTNVDGSWVSGSLSLTGADNSTVVITPTPTLGDAVLNVTVNGQPVPAASIQCLGLTDMIGF